MIRLASSALADLHSGCRALYPEEACGFLVGMKGKGDALVSTVFAARNALEPPAKRSGFAIVATDYLEAEERAARLGLHLIGIYHSHPDHPAEPSASDLAKALPFFSYVIVSVRRDRVVDVRSFVLSPGRDRFAPESVFVSSQTGPILRGEPLCPSKS